MQKKSLSLKTKSVKVLILCGLLALLMVSPSMAVFTELGGKPLQITGYINQGIQYGVAGDGYYTNDDVQALLLQAMLEFKYKPAYNLKVFTSLNADIDWSYKVLSDKNLEPKHFDEAGKELDFLDEYYTILKECHLTYDVGNFVFRLGKQIVSWGETDGVRVMDQINPHDLRRGIADVEFETTIIPIWLLKADYFVQTPPEWMQSLGFEFIFNPNADFISNFTGESANQDGGIWTFDVDLPFPPMLGFQDFKLGRYTLPEEPDRWDSDGYEYGFRIKTMMADGIYTFNYWDGVTNDPVTYFDLPSMGFETEFTHISPTTAILTFDMGGKWARQRFAGVTVSQDFPSLRSMALGGVSPLLRMEMLYGFDSSYATSGKNTPYNDEIEKYDEFKIAVSVDWKVRIPFLNPNEGISVTPQFIWHHILDYPDTYDLAQTPFTFAENNKTASLLLRTNYMHQKLTPMVFWMRNWYGENIWDVAIFSLAYEKDSHWNFKLSHTYVDGDLYGAYLSAKDNVSFTVGYRF